MSDFHSRRQHPSNRHQRDAGKGAPSRPAMVISCDDCAMQCTAACPDCVVTFVLRDEDDPAEAITLDAAEARAVRLLARAGLVPALQYQEAV